MRSCRVLGSVSSGSVMCFMPNTMQESLLMVALNSCGTSKVQGIFIERPMIDLKGERDFLRSVADSHTVKVVCTSLTLKEPALDNLDGPINQYTPVAYAALLRSFGNAKALSDGKVFHKHIIKIGQERDPFLGSLLVQMYVNCGALEDAWMCFAQLPERNVFAWNFVIGASVRHGQDRNALELFQQMQQEAVFPDHVTFVSILSACASQAALREGQCMHTCIAHQSDVVVETALITMYGKCGSLNDALWTFDKMPDRNVISWNAIIAAYTKHGHAKESIRLFGQMQQEGVMPNKVTFISILNACSTRAVLPEGKMVHTQILHSEFELDVIVKSALVNMYGNNGSLRHAHRLFDEMLERNIVSWNTIINSCAQCGHNKKVEQLFEQMLMEGIIPNKVTFISILKTCRSKEGLFKGRRIHTCIILSGFYSDLVLANALISMYGNCGSIDDAQKHFDSMLERNVVSWTAIIEVYIHNELNKDALQLFRQMQWEGVVPNKVTYISILSACACQAALADGKHVHTYIVQLGFESDIVVGTALVSMYGKCGSLEDAEGVFGKMHQRDVVAWNAMFEVYAQQENAKMPLYCLEQMRREGVTPTKSTYVSILSACATHAALADGWHMHKLIIISGIETDVVVATAIVNMYRRCGGLEDAREMFRKISERSIISWNAMLAAYAQHGHGKEALQLLHQMQGEGVVPDATTFSSVLSACSHSGLINEGGRCLFSMGQEHGITPTGEHYECLVDLLGRAGEVAEAEDLITKMPVQPTVVSWMNLLSACRSVSDMERGERVTKHMLELDPKDSSSYITLSNMYAAAAWENTDLITVKA